jgi:hypothetical protein
MNADPPTVAPISNSDLWAVVAALQQQLETQHRSQQRLESQHQAQSMDLAALRAELRALEERSADGAAPRSPRPVAPDASVCQLPLSADPTKAECGETEARPSSEPSAAELQRDLAELTAHHLALQRRFEDELAKPTASKPQLAHTRSSTRRTSFISDAIMALEHQDPARDENAQEHEAEEEEWELAESMWDACLLLGCKSKRYPGGVGFVVTFYAFVVFALNALIQTTIVFIVVYRLGTNPDVDSGTVEDMRCASRADRRASSPKRRVPCAGSTVRTSPTPSRTWTPSRMFLSQRRSATTWRGFNSLSKSTSSKTLSSTRKETLGLCSAAFAALCGSSK